MPAVAPPRIGAQLFTVTDYTQTIEGVARTFERVRAMGYTGVQVSAFGPVDPAEVVRHADANDLEIAATQFEWSDFRDDLDGLIETHQLWRCRHTAISTLEPHYREAGGIEQFVSELEPVVAKLVEARIDFSFHNHAKELARSPDNSVDKETWLARLYRIASPELLKAELDLYWIAVAGADPARWIRDLGTRQPLIHLKDMTLISDRTQHFAEVGEGNLNWEEIIRACREVGVEWALVEQDDCYGEDPFTCLATSYANLREMGLE